MRDTNNGMVADVFKRIGMPTNPSCYETADQLHRAVLRAYFLGVSDAYKEMEIEVRLSKLKEETNDLSEQVQEILLKPKCSNVKEE